MTKILGIDPGSRIIGFGLIDHANQNTYLASGILRIKSETNLALRLKQIFLGIQEIIDIYKPDCAVVEQVFVNINPAATLMLGQARGAIISALAVNNLPVHEYTALQIKKTVVGYGHADKQQMQIMIAKILHLNEQPKADAADALAAAICLAQNLNLNSKICGVDSIKIKKGRLK